MFHDGPIMEIQEFNQHTTRWEESDRTEPLSPQYIVRSVAQGFRDAIQGIQAARRMTPISAEIADNKTKIESFCGPVH